MTPPPPPKTETEALRALEPDERPEVVTSLALGNAIITVKADNGDVALRIAKMIRTLEAPPEPPPSPEAGGDVEALKARVAMLSKREPTRTEMLAALEDRAEAFCDGWTVRSCIDCSEPIAGGPTRCVSCVRKSSSSPSCCTAAIAAERERVRAIIANEAQQFAEIVANPNVKPEQRHRAEASQATAQTIAAAIREKP